MATTTAKTIRFSPGDLVGFKVLPSLELPVVNHHSTGCSANAEAKGGSRSDWAAIYPQLSFAQAMAYLPNQFDRGHSDAYVVALYAGKEVDVMFCDDSRMAESGLTSSEKATIIRELVPELPSGQPLMDAFGALEKSLCIIDCEDFELVVPHDMFNNITFETRCLFKFTRNETVPSIVGMIHNYKGVRVLCDKSALTDVMQLATQLEKQLDHTHTLNSTLSELLLKKPDTLPINQR